MSIILTANALRNLADKMQSDDPPVGVRERALVATQLRNHAFDLMMVAQEASQTPQPANEN